MKIGSASSEEYVCDAPEKQDCVLRSGLAPPTESKALFRADRTSSSGHQLGFLSRDFTTRGGGGVTRPLVGSVSRWSKIGVQQDRRSTMPKTKVGHSQRGVQLCPKTEKEASPRSLKLNPRTNTAPAAAADAE